MFSEVLITLAAHDLAIKSNLFYVPNIMSFDPHGQIFMERINGVKPLRYWLESEINVDDIIEKVGRSLAFVHCGLKNSVYEICKVSSTSYKDIMSQKVVIGHGDFNVINVGVQEDTGMIIIFDWSCNPAILWRAVLPDRELDVVWFLRAMLLQVRPLTKSKMYFAERSKKFLYAYSDQGNYNIKLTSVLNNIIEVQKLCIKKQIIEFKILSVIREMSGAKFIKELIRDIK